MGGLNIVQLTDEMVQQYIDQLRGEGVLEKFMNHPRPLLGPDVPPPTEMTVEEYYVPASGDVVVLEKDNPDRHALVPVKWPEWSRQVTIDITVDEKTLARLRELIAERMEAHVESLLYAASHPGKPVTVEPFVPRGTLASHFMAAWGPSVRAERERDERRAHDGVG